MLINVCISELMRSLNPTSSSLYISPELQLANYTSSRPFFSGWGFWKNSPMAVESGNTGHILGAGSWWVHLYYSTRVLDMMPFIKECLSFLLQESFLTKLLPLHKPRRKIESLNVNHCACTRTDLGTDGIKQLSWTSWPHVFLPFFLYKSGHRSKIGFPTMKLC